MHIFSLRISMILCLDDQTDQSSTTGINLNLRADNEAEHDNAAGR